MDSLERTTRCNLNRRPSNSIGDYVYLLILSWSAQAVHKSGLIFMVRVDDATCLHDTTRSRAHLDLTAV
jgi:hypothetical protein